MRWRQHKHGAAVLFITHDLALVAKLCQSVTVLHAGRVLDLNSISGFASHTLLMGRMVHLKLGVKETGKLSGKYVVGMALQLDAARQLAATLTKLADEAERKEPIEIRIGGKRKP